MTHFQQLQEEAIGSHGVITYGTMRHIGIRSPEISRWMRMGRIAKAGRGVYRLTSFPSQGIITDMAAILAEVGKGAYLYGESVLGFLNLCPVRSYVLFIATPARIRKTLPEGINVVRRRIDYQPTYISGIPCQRLEDAILSATHTIEPERLLGALDEAKDKGYFTEQESAILKAKVSHGNATPK